MRLLRILFLLALVNPAMLYAQQSFTLSGKVYTGDSIVARGAGITVDEAADVYTDSAGNFRLQLPGGKHDVRFALKGYNSQAIQLVLTKDTMIDIQLSDGSIAIHTVEIFYLKPPSEHREDGNIQLSSASIKKLPQFFGENDPMRAVQMQGGVQSGGEGSRGIFIRGGSPDQNLVLLDGAPVYNAAHIYGFISVFNGDAINKLTIYKDKYPSRFGGRLCSVLDIATNSGNKEKIKGSVSIGLATARFNVNGPIGGGKLTTFDLSARVCFAGLFSASITKMQFRKSGYDGALKYYFGDVNAKVAHRISAITTIEATFFTSNDYYSFNREARQEETGFRQKTFSAQNIYWANYTGSIALMHTINGRWGMKHHVSYSNYHINNMDWQEIQQYYNQSAEPQYYSDNESKRSSYINDISYTADFTCNIRKQKISVGGGVTGILFEAGRGTFKLDNNSSGELNYRLTGDKVNSIAAFVYAEEEYRPSRPWVLTAGLHGRTYTVQGKTFLSLLPRAHVQFNPIGGLYLRAGAAGLSQNLHMLAVNSTTIINDYWVPATAKAKPETGWNMNGGIMQKLPLGFEWSMDGFYRIMSNVIEYKEGTAGVAVFKPWESQIETGGKGRSYGAEFYMGRTTGKLTGSAAYTLAWSNRQFPGLNSGAVYPYKYDRRHNIATQLNYIINKHFELGATWVYGSGTRFTLPVQSYHSFGTLNDIDDDLLNGRPVSIPNDLIILFSKRNEARLPAYHHLDVSFTYRKQVKNLMHQFNLSIYNVYNNFNVFMVYSDTKGHADGSVTLSLKKISLFPVLPSVSYTINFM